jgi:hypothetical protein
LTYSSQNSKSCKFLTASEILPVTMGNTRTLLKFGILFQIV